MRIVVVDPSLFTIPYDTNLCGGIAQGGHDVTLYGRELRPGERLWGSGYALEPYFFRYSERNKSGFVPATWLKAGEYAFDALRFIRTIRNLRPDVVHFQWLPAPSIDRYVISALKKLGIRLVFTVHDTNPFNDAPSSRGQVFGWRRVLDDFDALVVHTASSKQILEHCGVRPPVAIVPHGLLSFGSAPDLRPTDNIFFFGAIKPYKGLEVLLEAFDMMQRPANLQIVGKPRDAAPWRAAVSRLKKHNRVTFEPRWFDDAEIPRLMAGAALVVFPYHRIDGSGALLTALAYEKPFVATKVGMFAELAGNNSPALVAPGDASGLASKLDEALSDLGPFRSISARIKAAVPSWVEIGRRTIELYEQLEAGANRSIKSTAAIAP